MNASKLVEHFNRVSEAPDAIPKLRKFILDLAVRGKLVEQNLLGETASDLLRNLRRGRAELIREGTIRIPRDHGQAVIDAWYSLPANWQWCLLSDVGAVVGGGTPPSGDLDNFEEGGKGTPWLTPADLGKATSRFIAHGARDLSEKGLRASSATLMPSGSVLFTSRAPIGYTAIATNPVTTNQGFKSVVPFVTACNEFIAIYFQAFADRIEAKASGTTFREVSGKVVAGLPFPLPPLAEQQRIVAKVHELMGLCNRLATAQRERECRRDRLLSATTGLMGDRANAQSLQSVKEMFLGHFGRLTTRSAHIDQIRRTIVGLAVRGQLLAQDPSDEPASELLRQIRSEQRTHSDDMPRSARSDVEADELPFDTKAGWQAVRIFDILLELQTGPFGSSLHQSDYEVGGIPVVNPASLKNGRIVPLPRMAVSTTTLERLATFKLRTGDIAMARRGEMGRCAVVSEREDGWLCGTGCLILRLPSGIYPRFLAMVIGSPFARKYLLGSAVGATMQNLNQSILRNLVIGLPPAAEQLRIVAKVDELMALCDSLQARIHESDANSAALLHAILERSIDGGKDSVVADTPLSRVFTLVPSTSSAAAPGKKMTRRVPIQGTIAAGVLTFAEQQTEGWLEIPIDWTPKFNSDSFILRVTGDSMNLAELNGKRIEHGDLVLVNKRQPTMSGEIVAARLDGESVLKRFARTASGAVLRAESTSSYPDIPFGPEIEIQGVVRDNLKSGSEFERIDSEQA